MTRFVFRLQPILNLRQAEEMALLNALAHLQRQRDAARIRLELLKASAAEAARRAAIRRMSSPDPCAEAPLYQYLRALDSAVQDQSHTLLRSQEAVDAKLAEVMEAVKARKSLEKLRDRQHAGHLRLAAAEEMKALDEGAALRFTHSAS